MVLILEINISELKETEEDVKNRRITPAIEKAGWDKNHQHMEYAFTDGGINIKGKKPRRGKQKRVDYLLSYENNLPLAIIEAKDQNHAVGDGIQQALGYGETLDVPFVYSSNGKSFLEHDNLTGEERELSMEEFPTPEELWQRYKLFKQLTPKEEEIITQPYYYDNLNFDKTPRYYQRIAINRTVEAIAQGKNRILLVMATGTGKTYTAFQIINKLYNSGEKKKILYLADRNILIDQTMNQDFKPFEKVMTKIEGKHPDSAYDIHFGLYQQLVDENKDKQPYEELKRDYFDLIVVDECHRGSAKADSQWRQILEYFDSAIQIGLTATPKETKDVSNISYFGEPLYTYSLKEGIDDGFLAPYKVLKVTTNIDANGYGPEEGKRDINGNIIEKKSYDSSDFGKNIVIEDRQKLVAKRITEFMKANDARFDKTIVFCETEEDAGKMREYLINENSDLVKQNSKYVMRITGNDKEGKEQLDYFIDANEKYPVIATTSQLLSTGVDCKTCKLIVLDKTINSPIEFKQIIGRGTRLREDLGKTYFTIMDFKDNVRNFADPEFNGEPLVDEDFDPTKPIGEKTPKERVSDVSSKKDRPTVKDVDVNIVLEQNLCYDKDGNIITQNLIDFSKKNILDEYPNLEEFLNAWSKTAKKEAIIEELEDHNVFMDELREAVGNDDLDDFDLICHIAYDKQPLTRYERVQKVKNSNYLDKYQDTAREVIESLLDKYATGGVSNLENMDVFKTEPFRSKFGARGVLNAFNGKNNLINSMNDLQKEIYS